MSEIPGIIKTCEQLIKRLDELRLELDGLRQRSKEDVVHILQMHPVQAAAYGKARLVEIENEAHSFAGSVNSVVTHYNEMRKKARKLGLKGLSVARFRKEMGFDGLDLQIRLGCIQIREYLKNMTMPDSG